MIMKCDNIILISNHYQFFGENVAMKRNFSSKRNSIYNTILNTTTHPSARWIYEQLKPDYPDLSLGTVYRNISLFKDEGMVNVVCTVNGEERIDGNTSPHTHFVCNCCGKVIDVMDDGDASPECLSLMNKGYTIDSKLVIYYGKCSDCCNA